jgi:hypothetical protein
MLEPPREREGTLHPTIRTKALYKTQMIFVIDDERIRLAGVFTWPPFDCHRSIGLHYGRFERALVCVSRSDPSHTYQLARRQLSIQPKGRVPAALRRRSTRDADPSMRVVRSEE